MGSISLDWVLKNRKLTDAYEYGPVWGENTKSFEEDFADHKGDALAMLQSMVRLRRDYTVLSDFKTKHAVKDHYLRYFKHVGFDLQDALVKCAEVSFLDEEVCFEVNSALASTDLLRKLCYVNEIQKNCKSLPERPVFFEIGAGIGSMARVMRAYHEKSLYIISDLPETLFYSYTYLNTNFPGLVHLVDEENIEKVFAAVHEDGGFILVPSRLKNKLPDIAIDVVLNTASLGEMTNQSCQEWFDFINHSRVGYVFLMNRFLNNWHLSHKRGNFSSLLLDAKWEILEWSLDPSFLKSTYEEMEPNYLMLVAEKAKGQDNEDLKEMAHTHLKSAEDSYFVKKYLETPDLMHARSHRPLYLGLGGPLYHYWQACRFWLCAKTVISYIQFLESWGSDKGKFEEIFSYWHMLFTMKKGTLDPVKRARKVWLYGAGVYGSLMLDILMEENIEVAGIFDSVKTGKLQGVDIIDSQDIYNKCSEGDLILIASSSWMQIMQQFDRTTVLADFSTYGDLYTIESLPELTLL